MFPEQEKPKESRVIKIDGQIDFTMIGCEVLINGQYLGPILRHDHGLEPGTKVKIRIIREE